VLRVHGVAQALAVPAITAYESAVPLREQLPGGVHTAGIALLYGRAADYAEMFSSIEMALGLLAVTVELPDGVHRRTGRELDGTVSQPAARPGEVTKGTAAMQTATVMTGLPRFLPVAGHHEAAPFYLTADMFGGMPVQVAGGEITSRVGRPVADPHRHEVDEVYFLISPNPGGARIEVLVAGERHELSSPALLHVPAGAEHCFLTLEAEPGSYCFGLLMGGA
jgi:hypothetical protein